MYKQKSLIFGAVVLMATVLVVGCGSRDTSDDLSFATQSVSSFDCSNTGSTMLLESECEVIINFFYETNGSEWKNNTHWLNPSQPIKNRYGLQVYNYRIIGIDLQSNNLSGNIPGSIFTLPGLSRLNLRSNNLSGMIPLEISNAISLIELDLSNTRLSGTLPFLGYLTKLTILNLLNSGIGGYLPSELGSIPSINKLFLQNNNFIGGIPDSFKNLRNISILWLNDNNLSGEIPNRVLSNDHLRGVYLQNNYFCGEIPDAVMFNWRYAKAPFSNQRQLNVDNNYLLNDYSFDYRLHEYLKYNSFLDMQSLLMSQIPTVCGTSICGDGFCSFDESYSICSLDCSLSEIDSDCLKNEDCISGKCDLLYEGYCSSIDGSDICDSNDKSSCKNEYHCERIESVIGGVCVANCGNGIVEGTEQCDDGNTSDSDGCSKACMIEPRDICGDGVCSGSENNSTCPSDCPSVCGNGVLEAGEACDLSLNCTSSCQCVSGFIPGPNGTCIVEGPSCGNGVLDLGEECDGKGQAQCIVGATCGAPRTRGACVCQYETVIGPDIINGGDNLGSTSSGTTAGSTSSSSGTTGNYGLTDGGSTTAGSTKGGSTDGGTTGNFGATDGGSTDGGVIKDTQEAVLFQDDSK